MTITRGQLQAVIACIDERWGEFGQAVKTFEGRRGGKTPVDGKGDGVVALANAGLDLADDNIKIRKELKQAAIHRDKIAKEQAKTHQLVSELGKAVAALKKQK